MEDWDLGGVAPVLLLLAVLGIRKYLAWSRERNAVAVAAAPVSAAEAVPPELKRLIEKAAAGYENGSLAPPRDVRDPAGWDRYWESHIEAGTMETAFNDWMASDPGLVGLLSNRKVRTILCVGNGLSSEAASLALHGFDVVALDLSSVPAAVHRARLEHPQHPVRRISGFSVGDDGTWTLGPPDPIPAELCPPMHRNPVRPNRGGGSLLFVTGDLMDPSVCPGPFDAIIERRTLQLFPEADLPEALERVTARLAVAGTFVSHQHQGCWKPPMPRTHFAEAWLAARGFALAPAEQEAPGSGRPIAHLMFSSG